MSPLHGHRWWTLAALVPGLLILAASLSPIMANTVAASSASARGSVTCDGPKLGQHIYDCANLLTPAEISTLEADAAAVDRAGAPTVVYLQVRDATVQQTHQDAGDLLNRWDVESHPDAGDGVVIFFNLKPGDLRHGRFALVTGQKHYQGNLPQSELDRIRDDVMTPLLADGKTAEGIAAGLQQVAFDLRYGPPPPPRSQVVGAFLGRLPINILALLFAGVVGLLYVRVRRKPPLSGTDGAPLDLLAKPGDLSPAMAGALLAGRVNNAQMEATVLDFARRGLLVIEPAGAKKVRMRLTGDGKDLQGFERDIWEGLVAQAADDQTLTSDDLAKVRTGWSWPRAQLRRELTEKGWYDPEAASARRRPLYIASAVGLVAAAVALLLATLSHEAWGVIAMVIFAVGAIAAFVLGIMVPTTTVEGEIAAAPWRGYRTSVADRAYEPNVDTDLPYIVALGLLGSLGPRLKAASERGYSPSWFRASTAGADDQYTPTVGFYPYWIVFHSSMAPVSSGGGGSSYSGGYSGGGAAGGGGGSAGSF